MSCILKILDFKMLSQHRALHKCVNHNLLSETNLGWPDIFMREVERERERERKGNRM